MTPGCARGLRQAIGRLWPESAIDDDEIRRRNAAQRLETGAQSVGAFDADARLHESLPDRRRLERRMGDDQGARALKALRPRFNRAGRLDRSAFGQADGEGEDRPSARIVGERQLATHQANELARDRKPQSGALEAAGVRAVALLETVEDRRPAIGRHAGSGVDDRESRLAPLPALDRDADAALIGELDRVAGEIGENLAQALAVRAHEARRRGAERRGDLDAFALGSGREQFHHAFDQLAQIDRLDDEIEMAGLDLREIEDLVDERDQRAARTADRLDVARILGIERGLAQEVGHAEDAADRGADLVAHRRQEARFGLVGRLGPVASGRGFLQPPEFVAQAFVLGGDERRARFRLLPGAGHGGGKRDRERDDRAGLKAQRANGEIGQTGAQIHEISRFSPAPRRSASGPMVSGGG